MIVILPTVRVLEPSDWHRRHQMVPRKGEEQCVRDEVRQGGGAILIEVRERAQPPCVPKAPGIRAESMACGAPSL